MLNNFTGADKVYIACGYTDLRRGIDGLASIVRQQFELAPFTNTLFLFCGRRRDCIKGLYWEQDGFVLLYKRLESGSFQWLRTENGGKAADTAAIPLAYGGTEHRAAEGTQGRERFGNYLRSSRKEALSPLLLTGKTSCLPTRPEALAAVQ